MSEDEPSIDYHVYTVGMICVQGFEMNAVRHILDREHISLPVNSQDSTIYVLGELKGHNVVIACLSGTQGKSASAIAATHMARTFPSIKHRILVGTGGGVPSVKNDIRLGDVVVSMPTTINGGVVEYDLGKDTETAFVRKGLNSPPPPVLRAAVYKMQIENDYRLSHKIKLSEANRHVHRRSTAEDILFQAEYLHQSSKSSCEQCDTTMAVQRPLRNDDAPRTFYGLIASGDRLIRSGIKRDAIADEINNDVLCFEMEAAGFINEFPAVVIRGISNYADSHKNDRWQNFAAASAATCAEELLSHLEPETPFHARAPQASRDIVHEFLADICETDPQNEMARIRHSKGGLIAECNTWIIQSPLFKGWQTSDGQRLLWMKGSPGKGKTMAMISLIEFQARRIGGQDSLCYFFCQSNEPHLNNAVSVLRALIWKLLWTNHRLAKYIPDEYMSKKDHRREMFDSPNAFAMLTSMLSRILRDRALKKVFVLIDGVDECYKGMGDLLEWLLRQLSDPSSNARWLISSRHTQQIEQFLRPGSYNVCLDLDLNEAHVLNSVINHFIKQRMNQIADRKCLSREERKGIESELRRKSEPTFLWVAFVCQRLQMTSRRRMNSELNKIPLGLAQVYDHMVERLEDLDDENRQLCKTILRVAIVVPEPLKIQELGAIAELPDDAIDDLSSLVELCGSFLYIRGGRVHLIHRSARDYFRDGMAPKPFVDALENEKDAIIRRQVDHKEAQSTQNTNGLEYLGSLVEDVVHPQSDVLALVADGRTKWVTH